MYVPRGIHPIGRLLGSTSGLLGYYLERSDTILATCESISSTTTTVMMYSSSNNENQQQSNSRSIRCSSSDSKISYREGTIVPYGHAQGLLADLVGYHQVYIF